MRRRHLHTIPWALALCVALFATSARAQETGGSFESSDWDEPSSGSSDWGSSGSSDYGSSGSSDWGSSGSSDYGSTSSYPATDYDTSSTSSYSPAGQADDGFVIFLVVLLLLILVGPMVLMALVSGGWRRTGSAAAYAGARVPVVGYRPSPGFGLVDVSMLQLAIDWRARKYVQAELAKLAREGDTASKEGRAALLAATTRALTSVKLAWLYAGARNFQPMPKNQAQQAFTRIANDARATFRQEIVRAAAGRVVTVEAVGQRAREAEGPGVVLVSVIVASWREIFDVDATRAASIDQLLASLARLRPTDVVALSVVWTPAAEEDRMSSDELVQRHPNLVRIGDIGGRVFCSYCHAPRAEEVSTCPNCGAPGKPLAPG